MLLQEGLALAVAEAEEDDIHLVERHFAGEAEVRLADETFVDIADGIAGVALAVGKDNLCLGMPQEHPYQFAAGVAGSAKYSYFYHNLIFTSEPAGNATRPVGD